jgi:hypothetical protein
MTRQTLKPAAPQRMSLAQKLALASSASAAITGIAAPHSANATPIQSTSLPLSPTSSVGSNDWDVDGDGTTDFRLRNASVSTAISFLPGAQLIEMGQSTAAPNYARLVSPVGKTFGGFAKLSAGFIVGQTMTGGFKFNSAGGGPTVTLDGQIGSIGTQGWAVGDIGYFGFKFTATDGHHFGWGQMQITGSPKGQGFTFLQAYYNNVPGALISVGAVPEIDPASAGSVLSLVMGSLAMLERRRMRRAADASATTVSA